MRCLGCNQALSDYEMSFKVGDVPVEMCMDCIDEIEDMATQIEANLKLATEADMPLKKSGLTKFYERSWTFD
jgi:hypothetical protein